MKRSHVLFLAIITVLCYPGCATTHDKLKNQFPHQRRSSEPQVPRSCTTFLELHFGDSVATDIFGGFIFGSMVNGVGTIIEDSSYNDPRHQRIMREINSQLNDLKIKAAVEKAHWQEIEWYRKNPPNSLLSD